MTNLPNSTRNWARWMHRGVWVTGLLLVVYGLYVALASDQLVEAAWAALNQPQPGWETSPLTRAVLVAGQWVKTAAVLYTLVWLGRLFDAYARDIALSLEAARAIRGIGVGLMALALLALLAPPFLSLTLSIDAPVGQRQLTVSLSSDLLIIVLAGGMMLLIGVVMKQAVDVARENESFV